MPTRVGLRVALAVVAVTTVAGALITRDRLIGAPLPGPASSRERQPLSSTGQYLFYANSGHVKQGVRYQFQLYTHCGLDYPTGPDFDGSFWQSVGPGDDGSGNPPAGFGNPHDNGTMTLVSANIAQFRGSSGASMRFTRQSRTKTAGPCS
jgi:hypothetical protein